MYAVIFSAEIGELDGQYAQTAAELRALAFARYGCIAFESRAENGRELSISYWHSLDDIARWKQDARHLEAQAAGRARWYRSYRVEVVEVLRAYSSEETTEKP